MKSRPDKKEMLQKLKWDKRERVLRRVGRTMGRTAAVETEMKCLEGGSEEGPPPCSEDRDLARSGPHSKAVTNARKTTCLLVASSKLET